MGGAHALVARGYVAATPPSCVMNSRVSCALLKPRIIAYHKPCYALQHFGPSDFRNGSMLLKKSFCAGDQKFCRQRKTINPFIEEN
jgi:hypothetical protein